MSERLSSIAGWNRARALKLHEHFLAAALAVQGGAKAKSEWRRIARQLNGLTITFPGGEMRLEASVSTVKREWYYWLAGGRGAAARPEHVRRPEALLCAYKAGCGGHKKMPRLLVKELHRRLTHATGGRDKHGKSPISVAWDSIRRDHAAGVAVPGIDPAEFPPERELPWHPSTIARNKPARTLRAGGNRGSAAQKGVSAYVSLDYSRLRRGELYTLDDVRVDIVCIDEATGKAVEVTLYVLMEVGSRLIVNYVLVQSAEGEKVKQEDVEELIALGLQTPGFGVGVGYVTHLLFERGATACADALKTVLEGMSEGGIRVHKTGMNSGVRWVGAARDVARGNAAGKAVIESFNRWLHYALLHLPGQRGNHRDNQPQHLGAIGGASFFARPAAGRRRESKGTMIDEAERLAQFDLATGRRLKLRLGMLKLWQLNAAIADAIKRHNAEPGHDYRGHGKHFQEEVAPGVWRDTGEQVERAETIFPAAVAELADAPDPGVATAGVDRPETAHDVEVRVLPAAVRAYALKPSPGADPAQGVKQLLSQYWRLWNELHKARPDLDRHALTRRTLGRVPRVSEMTADELGQLLRVFAAIARDTAAASLP